MQAPSLRKKPKFFVRRNIILIFHEKMQVLFAIFVAEIINNF